MTRFSSTRLQGVCSVMPKTTRLSQNGNGFQQTWISHNHVSTYYIYIYVHSYLFLYIYIYIYIYIYSPHPKNFASPSRSRPWQQLPQRVQRWALVGEGLAQRGAAGGTDRSGVAQEPPEILGRWKNRGAGYHLSSIGMVHTDHVHSRETYQHLSSIIKQTCC